MKFIPKIADATRLAESIDDVPIKLWLRATVLMAPNGNFPRREVSDEIRIEAGETT